MTKNNYRSNKTIGVVSILITVAIIVVVNILSSFKYFRLDLTNDKVHTLSEKTINVIDSINGVMNIEVYLEDEGLTQDLLKLRKAIEEKLQDFKEVAGDKIKFTFINPSADEGTKEAFQKHLLETGLQDIVVDIKEDNSFKAINIWPCAKILYKETAANVQFIHRDQAVTEGLINKTINELEYSITKGIADAAKTDIKKIAFVRGHGELSYAETFAINQTLSQFYVTDSVIINGQINSFKDFDAAIIAKPNQEFSDKDQLILDQFIMKGGKVIWLIDPLDIEEDSLKRTGNTMGLARNLGIENMIYKYGVRINKDLILDKRCAPTVVPGFGGKLFNWYFHPFASLETNKHPITKNLNPIKLQYAASLDAVGDTSIKKTVILESSENAMHYKAPARVNYRVLTINPDFTSHNKKPFQPIGYLLEGKFKSMFTTRASKETKNAINFKSESPENKMLVIGDGDLIRNHIFYKEGQPYPVGLEYEPLVMNSGYAQKIYGNTDFFLNAVDYLLGEDQLIELRAREKVFRPIDESKIEDGKKAFWQFINIVLPIVILLVLGFIQFFIRKRKYSTK